MRPRTSADAIEHWLRRYGLKAERQRLIANVDTEVHRIAARRGRGQMLDLALRIYPAADTVSADVDAEIAWLQAAAEAGLQVPAPLVDREGHTLQTAPSEGDGRIAVLLTWLVGRQCVNSLTIERLRRVGRLTGALHRLADGLVAQGRVSSVRQGFGNSLHRWAEGGHEVPGWTPTQRHAVRRAAAGLDAALQALPRDSSAWGFVHSDLHLWNLLFTGTQAGAFDFSECGWGHHALDLAAPLQYIRHPLVGFKDHSGIYPALREALFEGYAEQRALPAEVRHQTELYIAARMLMAASWIISAWLRPDERPWGPAFLAALPAAVATAV